jgi:hypothetical protein
MNHALVLLPGGRARIAELRNEVASLSDAVEQRSTFMSELDIARRIWRAHPDLVEPDQYPWPLVGEHPCNSKTSSRRNVKSLMHLTRRHFDGMKSTK